MTGVARVLKQYYKFVHTPRILVLTVGLVLVLGFVFSVENKKEEKKEMESKIEDE